MLDLSFQGSKTSETVLISKVINYYKVIKLIKFNLSKRRLAYCISATDRYSLCCLRFTHSVDLHQLLPILRLLTCKFIKAQGSTDILTVWPSKR